MSKVTMIGSNMQLDFYKRTSGFEDEKTTLHDCCKIAEKYGMSFYDTEHILRTDGGQIVFDGITLWSEDAIIYV